MSLVRSTAALPHLRARLLTQRAQSQHGLDGGKNVKERKVRLNPTLISPENINMPGGGTYGHEGPEALEIHLSFISALN